MSYNEEGFKASGSTLYCEEHKRYYRVDTGCMFCNMAGGGNLKQEEIKEVITIKPDNCPSCGNETLIWNPSVNMYECTNTGCRRRISRFTKAGLGELLKDTPHSVKKISPVQANDSPRAAGIFAVKPKKFPPIINEYDEYDMDIAMPLDTEYSDYILNKPQKLNKQIALVKTICILLVFLSLGLAFWTVYLLYVAAIAQTTGIILLAAIFGVLIWCVYALMSYKSLDFKFIGLFIVTIIAVLVTIAFAGIEPFSSILYDMIQF